MRITCPECGASYDVPDTLLLAGRPVRCARCSGEWVPLAEPVPEAAEAVVTADAGAANAAVPIGPVPEPAWPIQPVGEATLAVPPAAEPGPRLVTMSPPAWRSPPTSVPSSRPRRGQRLALTGWVATALVLAAALWGAYAARGPIMRAWPPSQRVYAPLGLAR